MIIRDRMTRRGQKMRTLDELEDIDYDDMTPDEQEAWEGHQFELDYDETYDFINDQVAKLKTAVEGKLIEMYGSPAWELLGSDMMRLENFPAWTF
jgi:hypothetical protein